MSFNSESFQKSDTSYNSAVKDEIISDENKERSEESRFFLIPYLVFSIWMNIGAHLDAWSHNNIPEVETFFTPYHAVL